MELPPPDARKLLGQFDEWVRSDVTAGRAMANLKTGGLGFVLEANADEALSGPWVQWEKGKLGPTEALVALQAAGVRAVLESLSGQAAAAG